MVFYVRLAWFFSHATAKVFPGHAAAKVFPNHATAKVFPGHAAGAILHTAFMAFWLMMGGGSIPI
jgi:hypothetical protein